MRVIVKFEDYIIPHVLLCSQDNAVQGCICSQEGGSNSRMNIKQGLGM